MNADNECERPAPSIVAFRDARWAARWVVVGLGFLLLWRSISLIDREWLSQFPPWLFLVVAGLAPQAFLLFYPIITRNPNGRTTFGIPTLARCLVELAIAVPVVMGTIVILATGDYVVGRVVPGISLTPEAVKTMARSPDQILVLSRASVLIHMRAHC